MVVTDRQRRIVQEWAARVGATAPAAGDRTRWVASPAVPTSFAAHLAAMDDERLAGLLRRRPDLCRRHHGPPVWTFDDLADRAGRWSSQAAVLVRLDRFERAVLDLVLLNGSQGTVADVVTVSGGVLDTADAAVGLDALAGVGLVWFDDDGRWHVAGQLRSQYLHPCGLGRPFERLAAKLTKDQVVTIADHLYPVLDVDAVVKDDYVRAVADLLADRRRVEAVLGSCPDDELVDGYTAAVERACRCCRWAGASGRRSAPGRATSARVCVVIRPTGWPSGGCCCPPAAVWPRSPPRSGSPSGAGARSRRSPGTRLRWSGWPPARPAPSPPPPRPQRWLRSTPSPGWSTPPRADRSRPTSRGTWASGRCGPWPSSSTATSATSPGCSSCATWPTSSSRTASPTAPGFAPATGRPPGSTPRRPSSGSPSSTPGPPTTSSSDPPAVATRADKPIGPIGGGCSLLTGVADARRRLLATLADLGEDTAAEPASLGDHLGFLDPLYEATNPDLTGGGTLGDVLAAEADLLGLRAAGGVAAPARAVAAGDWDRALADASALLPDVVDQLLVQADLTVVAPGPVSAAVTRGARHDGRRGVPGRGHHVAAQRGVGAPGAGCRLHRRHGPRGAREPLGGGAAPTGALRRRRRGPPPRPPAGARSHGDHPLRRRGPAHRGRRPPQAPRRARPARPDGRRGHRRRPRPARPAPGRRVPAGARGRRRRGGGRRPGCRRPRRRTVQPAGDAARRRPDAGHRGRRGRPAVVATVDADLARPATRRRRPHRDPASTSGR